MSTQNRLGGTGVSQVYDAFDGVPTFDAAYTEAGDMGSTPALAQLNLTAQDGNIWTPVGN